jgi:hypothetical protein
MGRVRPLKPKALQLQRVDSVIGPFKPPWTYPQAADHCANPKYPYCAHLSRIRTVRSRQHSVMTG